VEREFVALHRALGVAAHRVPLSGAVEGYKGDLRISVRDRVLTAEVKARASGDGFRTLERWLAENHLLFLRRNNAPALVLLPWEIWAWLIGGGHENEAQHGSDGDAP
jgi:Holliday junction resolvase